MKRYLVPRALCLVVVASSALTVTGASLRRAQNASAVSADDALSAALRVVSNVASKEEAKKAATQHAASNSSAVPPGQHAKLDVGFAGFQDQLMSMVRAELKTTKLSTALTEKLAANVTSTIDVGVKEALKPIKMSIGKTWMALPQDSQKSDLVASIKQSFAPIFANALKSFSGRLELAAHRTASLSTSAAEKAAKAGGAQSAAEEEALLATAEQAFAAGILNEHCYGDDTVIHKAAGSKAKPEKKFCMQSPAQALAHRLNDAQGLLSMSMRFEAGAMALAQKKAKGKATTEDKPLVHHRMVLSAA